MLEIDKDELAINLNAINSLISTLETKEKILFDQPEELKGFPIKSI